MYFVIAVDEGTRLPRWTLRAGRPAAERNNILLLKYEQHIFKNYMEYLMKDRYKLSELSAKTMLNILREVEREDLEILDVETLMKLFEKQMQVRGANSPHQSYLQVIWRKLYETYFIKKDLQCDEWLLAHGADGPPRAAGSQRDDANRRRSKAQ